MKTLLTALLLTSMMIGSAQQTDNDELTVTMNIEGLKVAEGKLGIQLYNSQEELVMRQWVPVDALEMTAKFEGVEAGTYAIQFYHDENDDGEMNFHWYGAPKEGYGNSNDVKGFFGPPEFVDQLVTFTESSTITMKVIK